jgi:hypothetical protein
MKTKLIFMFVLLICPCSFQAQNQDSQKEVIAIKKDSKKYIYGEGTGQNEEDAYAIAKERLLFNVKRYVASDSELSTANGIVLDKIQSKTKKLTYENDFSFKVVCLYINKNDIIPLFVSNSNIKENEKSNDDEQNKIANNDNQEKVDKNSTHEKMHVLSNSKKEKQKILKSSVEPLTDSDNSYNIKDTEYTKNMTEREKVIIGNVSKLKSYSEIKEYLSFQKSNNNDIQFGLVRMALMRNHCYWLILTTDKKLIAIIDPNISINLLDKTKVEISDYKDNPKLWLQINND